MLLTLFFGNVLGAVACNKLCTNSSCLGEHEWTKRTSSSSPGSETDCSHFSKTIGIGRSNAQDCANTVWRLAIFQLLNPNEPFAGFVKELIRMCPREGLEVKESTQLLFGIHAFGLMGEYTDLVKELSDRCKKQKPQSSRSHTFFPKRLKGLIIFQQEHQEKP